MDKIIDLIKDALGDFLNIIMEWNGSWIKKTLVIPAIQDCKTIGEDLFSDFINSAIVVLQKSPSEWNSDGWEFILQNVNTVFIAFGCQLVVLFFLIGFLAESIDPRHDVRIETLIKALFKILFAQFLVYNSANIVTGFFQFVSSLTSGVITYKYQEELPEWKYQLPEWEIVDNVGNLLDFDILLESLEAIDLLFVTGASFIYMLVMIGSGAIIAYTAYIRFFKIMLIVPYGALASSTVAGNHALNHTAMQFYKYVLSVVLEAVTIIVAIGLYTSIMAGSQFEIITAKTENMYLLYTFINRSLAALLLVGVVKGSGALTQKVIGL